MMFHLPVFFVSQGTKKNSNLQNCISGKKKKIFIQINENSYI